MEKIIGTVPGKCRKKREKARLTLNNNPEISWHMKKSRRTYNGVHLNKKSNTQDVVEQSLTIYEGEKEEWDEAYTEDVYTFKNDGSGTYKDVSGSTPYTEDFTWSISGNKLKITFNGYSDEATIKTLNGTTLVIIAQEKDEDEEFYDEISFKKK